ncbi:hypothetical protein IQ255_10385 [Pleurocapsales cyanobacterium LEGE 10410]|nr:hypothetical protein [Pleurocapsales cyanobacterium LEGE 10410]
MKINNWTRGEAYVDLEVDYYEQKYQERLVQNLTKKAHSLGFDLTPQSVKAYYSDTQYELWSYAHTVRYTELSSKRFQDFWLD